MIKILVFPANITWELIKYMIACFVIHNFRKEISFSYLATLPYYYFSTLLLVIFLCENDQLETRLLFKIPGLPLFWHFNKTLVALVMHKYKRLNGRKTKAGNFLENISKKEPELFAHWKIGIKLPPNQLILLKSPWAMVLMDQYTRRIIGFAVL